MHDMHRHEIPWPASILRDLGEAPGKMHVTLSYYEDLWQGSQGGEGNSFLGDDLRGRGSIWLYPFRALRTLRANSPRGYGFWRKCTPASSTPWWAITSAV
jgi:hypothetical protein